MTRILVCSNDQTFCPALNHAYHARGLDVVAGIPNLDPLIGRFDVVHLHWPEEQIGWQRANPERVAEMMARLDWFAQRAVLVGTVHNLVPHAVHDLNSPDRDYYSAFYQRMDVIGHFSDFSRQRYGEVYPELPAERQVMHPINSFAHLLPLAQGRDAARAALGLGDDEPVFAVFGAMRHKDELTLMREAWSRFGRADARLLFAAKTPWGRMGPIDRRVDKLVHKRWLRDSRILTLGDSPNDRELVRMIEAADGVIIPRAGNHLNSGLIPLSLTFGTPIIAPDRGANRQILPLPANTLYEAGNPAALAAAMEQQAAKSSAEARAANLAYRETIGWDRILDLIWPRIAAAGQAKGLAAFAGQLAG